jgi:hypothetical protein
MRNEGEGGGIRTENIGVVVAMADDERRVGGLQPGEGRQLGREAGRTEYGNLVN